MRDEESGLHFYTFEPELRRQITLTVSRLPSDVAEWVREHCVFMAFEKGDYGEVWPGTAFAGEDWWFVFLKSPLPKRHAHGIIAHEIAHAWLHHDKFNVPPDGEEQAHRQARAWGFRGLATRPE